MTINNVVYVLCFTSSRDDLSGQLCKSDLENWSLNLPIGLTCLQRCQFINLIETQEGNMNDSTTQNQSTSLRFRTIISI